MRNGRQAEFPSRKNLRTASALSHFSFEPWGYYGFAVLAHAHGGLPFFA
jgi:hypothetical protein